MFTYYLKDGAEAGRRGAARGGDEARQGRQARDLPRLGRARARKSRSRSRRSC
ncbi:MAG: hypothetical protein MZV63_64485 [Marinilabiliales bacterium]|nr:hypothetical protein [Marinilabiliales bacterium]